MSYSAAVFPDLHTKQSLLGDMKLSSQRELLDGKVSSAILCSLLSPLNRFCESWLSKADELICVSNKQREIMEPAMTNLAGKLRVVYNPIPGIEVAEKNLGQPAFIYVGGDKRIKGFPFFLDASQKVLNQGFKVNFLLTGHYMNNTQLLITKLNRKFSGLYTYLGFISHKEVLRLNSLSSALIFPSILEEPLPYAVVESMIGGTIPIASSVGGVPEIVRGTYAENMLCTPNDSEEIVDRIRSVLSLSREQLGDISVKLRESTLQRFDNEQIKRQLLNIFN